MDNCGCAMARKQEGKERWQQGRRKETKEGKISSKGIGI